MDIGEYIMKTKEKIGIAKTAIIDKNVSIGKGVKIYDHVIIQEGCEIGDYSRIGFSAVLRPETKIGKHSTFGTLSVSEGHNKIGNYTMIHSQCHITSQVMIGDQVFIAPFFVGANTPRICWGRNYPVELKPYKIEYGVRIGVGVTVLPDVTLGRECLIGAGSVVTKDIPPFMIAYGHPAEIVRKIRIEEVLNCRMGDRYLYDIDVLKAYLNISKEEDKKGR